MDIEVVNSKAFEHAIASIDAGDLGQLGSLLSNHPELVAQRFHEPGEGYFKHPFLIWFVANNPVRHAGLPLNIVAITRRIIQSLDEQKPPTRSQQLDYAFALVATGRIPREMGVQLDLLDVFLSSGAQPCDPIQPITHGNPDVARYLIAKGAPVTLPVAAALQDIPKMEICFGMASESEKLTAVAAASFSGNEAAIEWLIRQHATVNGFPDPDSGFHSHATALHQAVFSGSTPVTKLLVNAGADVNVKDKIHQGTPLDWACYLLNEQPDPDKRYRLEEIRTFLEN